MALALREKLAIITGGPGTGKTTIVSCIPDLYKQVGARVLLMAPTCRAAKRLSETTGAEAATIHRALEFSPRPGASGAMPPSRLRPTPSWWTRCPWWAILRTVPPPQGRAPRGALTTVVDADPAAGGGARERVEGPTDSGVVPVTRLTQIYRQARESLIVVNAHRINQGAFPDLAGFEDGRDFVYVGRQEPEDIKAALLKLVCDELPERYGFDPVKDLQVITPMHRGPVGVQNLNHGAAAAPKRQIPPLHLRGPGIQAGGQGDAAAEQYYKEVFNGDIGLETGRTPPPASSWWNLTAGRWPMTPARAKRLRWPTR